MVQAYRSVANAAVTIIILLLYLSTCLEAQTPRLATCPIGYQSATNRDGGIKCYRKKGPETFEDKFKDCAGNQYTLQLLTSLDITLPDKGLWTDYRNVYDGGPFVDWSGDWSMDILPTTYDVKLDSLYSVNEELCVVRDPVRNLTAVRCDEEHYRYCIIDAYPDVELGDDFTNNDVCEDLVNSNPDESLEWSTFWFPSPNPSCLLKVEPKFGTSVRMTWEQAHKKCEDLGGSLLNRGWIYSNFPAWYTGKELVFPFGVRASTNLTLLRYDAGHDNAFIPSSQWLFNSTPTNMDYRLGAVAEDTWYLVNSTYLFLNVLCEKTIPLQEVNLNIFLDPLSNKTVLITNATDLKQKDIHCFTDSSRYYPQRVPIEKRRKKPGYELKYIQDGYYWCVHSNTKQFYTSESNKFLWISKSQKETDSLYAVNVTYLARDYNLRDIDSRKEFNNWKKKIEEYVSFSTKYVNTYNSDYDGQTIMTYKKTKPDVSVRSIDVALKRIYLNSRSALLHVRLPAGALAARPGAYEDVQVGAMKPARACRLPAPAPAPAHPHRLPPGEEYRVSDCKIYKCIGDYNNGLELLITAERTCNATVSASTTTVEVGEALEPRVSVFMPTPSVYATSTTSSKIGNLQDEASSSEEDDQPVMDNVRPTEANKPDCTTTTVNVVDHTEPPEVIVIPSTYPPLKPPTRPPVVEPTTEEPELTPVVTVTPIFPPELLTTPPPPLQQLEEVVQTLEELLNNTEPVLVANISQSFDQMDHLMAEETEELDIPSRLLHLLEDLGGRLYLEGKPQALTVRDNIALLVADNVATEPLRGLKIAVRDNDSFVEDAFQFIKDEITDTQLSADANEVVISLPESVMTTNRRISFVVFRNDRAFRSTHHLYSVNSRVLSVNIENTTQFSHGEVIDIHMSPLLDTVQRNETRSCAYWEFLDEDSGGYWSQDGCTFIRATSPGMLDTCRCTHLTHFAEVLVPRTVFSEHNENVLEVLSAVGCFMSIFGLICVGVTALTFRAWRRDYSNKVWLQLCISIFILSIAFIIVIFAHFEEYNFVCMFTGIVLHFSVLSSFCWMLVAAVLSYRRLVTVFTRDASHKLLRASAFAWGLPCAVVGILLSVSPHAYSGRFDEKNPSTAFCYPSGLALWLSVYGPIALMLLVNWTLFGLIVRSVFASRRNHPNRIGNRHSSDRTEALRCASVSFFLVFLFGLPWLFGLFAMNVVLAYLFVLLTTFQGFVLFLFFVLGNKKTRDLWLNKLKIKQTKKIPVTSSTYVNNRSTTGNVNSRANHPQTIEAKVSVPKSLNSQDNSRFS